MRELSFTNAILEAQEELLSDKSVILIGEGVGDPKNIFGTTTGLKEKYPDQVFDSPISEAGLTGICIGASLNGIKPILVHQRMDFSMYAMDQVVNNAAKIFSMYGGQKSCPIVIRMIVGRGWGQGNQHSQNLEALYAHIPGLKVVVPSTAYAVKGLLHSSVSDPNPVIFVEHRWLGSHTSDVPEIPYTVPLGKAEVRATGGDITIVAWGHALVEALHAAEFLRKQCIYAEVVDMQTIRPLDMDTIKESCKKTGRLLVVSDAWKTGGVAGEILARVFEDEYWPLMKRRPKRLSYPDFPSPSSPGLTKQYYPGPKEICFEVTCLVTKKMFDMLEVSQYQDQRVHDVPDASFKGPF